jgi:hypothetical protein
MVKIAATLLLIVSLVGCATGKETYTPSGKKGYTVSCDGAVLGWSHCYEKAGEICKEKGYNILAGGTDKGTVVSGTQYGLYGGTIIYRNMLIECKE